MEGGEIGSLTIVGTGILAAGHVTPQAQGYVEEADKVFFVVAEPVTRMWLESLNPTAESLADAYGEGKARRRSYREMADRMLEPVRNGLDVCVAFYGHPGILVDASRLAMRQARQEGHEARMLPAISSLDCLFADLEVDPSTCGCQSYEATDFLLRRRKVDPTGALVLFQVGAIGVRDYRREPAAWNRQGLNVLRGVLLESYCSEHDCVIYEASLFPMFEPGIQRLTLDDLDEAEVSIGSTLYVPPRGRSPIDPEMATLLGIPLTS